MRHRPGRRVTPHGRGLSQHRLACDGDAKHGESSS